ncbi:MAG: DUF4279 domain-containing protein [Methylococcaceae bacterium]
MNSIVNIYFSIRSDTVTSDFLTNYLNLVPSSFCVKGAIRREGQTPYVEHVWTIKISDSDRLDMEEQMQKLVETLLPLKLKLKNISDQCLFDVECVVHIYEMPTTPIINFKKNVVQFFAEIGADLGVEVYV